MKTSNAKPPLIGGKYRLRPMRSQDYSNVLVLWKRTEDVGLNESERREQITFF